MSLNGYRERYMENYNEQIKNIATTTSFESDDGATEHVKKWMNGCLYLCKICQKNIAGIRNFTLHLNSEHDTNFNKYDQEYKGFKMARIHFCKICSKNVKHEPEFLRKHFKKNHSMTVSDYYYKYKPKMPKVDQI